MSTPPQISSALPISGDLRGGTQVDISGSGLSNATAVFFGMAPATEFAIESDTLVFAITPPGAKAGAVPITVVTPNGNSVPSSAAEFTYIPIIPPSITSVFPALGAIGGGTQITIRGSNLHDATAVNFGAIPATQFLANSDGSILVVSPPGLSSGIVPVTVTSPSGSSASTPAGLFNYVPAQGAGGPLQGGSSQGSASQSGAGSSQAGSSQGSSQGLSSLGGLSQGGSGQGGGSSQGASSQGGLSQSGSSQGGPSKSGGSQSGSSQGNGQSQGNPTQGSGQKSSGGSTGSGSSAASGGPSPADFIPGGLGPVPGGLTGLGGTAGTGAGFGVGTLLPGGGGSAPESNLPYYVDPGLTAQLVQSLLNMVQSAASPDAIEAQNLILRRMALQGDVVGSRIPPPRNISEIGGYLNLLGTLKENSMREQALAGVLGVAGPTQALGWITNTMPLSMVPIPNDRPPVSGQSSVPLTVLIRSDFVGPLQSALKTLHSYGATLPLTSPSVITLPKGGTGSSAPTGPNILFYLGRAVSIAPNMAITVPGADPIALVSANPKGPFQLASNVLPPVTANVPPALQTPADLFAVVCTPTSQSVTELINSSYIYFAPILAIAGYYPLFPIPVPASSASKNWAWLINTTGLVAGSTELGDELSLLYRQDQIASSVFASMLTWTWNGSAFTP